MAPNSTSKLGDYFSSSREKGYEGLPLMSVTLNDGLVFRDSLDRKTDTNLDPNEHLIIKPGYIAYNMMRVWQGALGRAAADGLVSPAYVVIKPNEKIDSLYAEYLFKSARMIYLFWAFSYGLTRDRLRLYYNDFARIPVVLLPLPEQKKIAQILSTWDKAIATTEQLLANSQQQKKALMQKLLTGKKRLLDENGVRFSGEWSSVTVRQMGKVVTGGTPDTQNSEYWDGELAWVTPTDITKLRSRFVSKTSRTITDLGVRNSSATILPSGSLLVCTRATVGESAISSTRISTNQGFKNLVPSDSYDVNFLYYLFKQNVHEIVRRACGSTFLEISKKDFEQISMICPEKKEQKRIAAALALSDERITSLQTKLSLLSREKKALVQQLLTGKRRVKVDEVV